MEGSKEHFEHLRQQYNSNIDCSGHLFEEWLREEPNLGAEHSVFIANK